MGSNANEVLGPIQAQADPFIDRLMQTEEAATDSEPDAELDSHRHASPREDVLLDPSTQDGYPVQEAPSPHSSITAALSRTPSTPASPSTTPINLPPATSTSPNICDTLHSTSPNYYDTHAYTHASTSPNIYDTDAYTSPNIYDSVTSNSSQTWTSLNNYQANGPTTPNNYHPDLTTPPKAP
ncbi:hypothetical protein BDK51DRAFT_33926 [Blyttiomyces helicus]|uniref:Uncharacterized protein n=1 Tax=Blyttiomyces helicus TaxID=388810 RepID=A0A4P9VUF6_9FUNG|nr:hypothetical protein BDK51DRAFT_33926 [Blyttiomyces helicus]|eukprot:RKO82712.1 hypothetical protein BDK51DRAFT_33926 [Blyttiomyces helicus]